MLLRRKNKKNSGITLIEIIITTIVFALLALVAFLNIPPQMAKARDAERKIDLRKIRIALITHHTIKNFFPDNLTDCNQPFNLGSSQLIANFPCDPQSNDAYYYEKEGDQFKIYTNLENENDPSIEIIGCSHGCGPDCRYNYGTSSTNTYIDRCIPPEIIYACSPGGHSGEGQCDEYDDPEISECPKVYINDPICQNECGTPANRCQNASGKSIPDED